MRGRDTNLPHAMALRKDGLGRRRKENSSTPLRAHQSAREEKGRLEPNSKRLSQTLSDEPNTRTVGCEMDGRTEIESGRLDLRSDGCKGGPIGPIEPHRAMEIRR